MLSLAAKTLLALAAAAMASAIGYGVTIGDRSGTALFVVLGFAAATSAFALAGAGVRDLPPAGDADEALASTSYGSADAAGSTVWPAAGALAAAVFAAGLAYGRPVVTAGVVLAALAGAGWFGASVRDHHSWTEPVRERVGLRLLSPLGIPVGATLLVAVIAISLSRVLLAVDKDAAAVIAVAVAFLLLGGFAFLASRPISSGRMMVGLAGVAAVAVVGTGIVGAVVGEREFEVHHSGGEVALVAQNTEFSRETLSLPAEQTVRIDFTNRDTAPHNFAIYNADGSQPIRSTAPITQGRQVYEVETPAAGEYMFICEIHPTAMTGKLELEPAGGDESH